MGKNLQVEFCLEKSRKNFWHLMSNKMMQRTEWVEANYSPYPGCSSVPDSNLDLASFSVG